MFKIPQPRPITDLQKTNGIPEIWHVNKELVFITKNEFGDFVVMSMETYESMLEIAEKDVKIIEVQIEYAWNERRYNARSAFDSFKRKHFEKI